jgi:2-polyprenyl-3-methyl-5-hydroxy-6-metoxy-1,4-benzoquinol methylase
LASSGSGFSEWDNFWKKHHPGKPASWSKRRIINILSNYIKPGMNVLDAGCGTGFFSSYFISMGCNVYSMDYSDRALSIAKDVTANKARAYIKADILDETALKGIDIKFDIIFSDGLLEHYSKEEQDRIIGNIKAVKKEQGYIVNFAPNRFSLWSMIRPFVMDIKERPFILRELLDLHARNRLKSIANGGINVLPFRVSPERLLARHFGMLFYCVAI